MDFLHQVRHLGNSWIATDESGGLAFCMGKDGTKELLERTKKLSKEVDLTIVYIHWGLQGKSSITKRQKELFFNC
jgi:poly-gamma-glutamate capsule biosynthesis protein CapA/YwtB (metallophosphatase superfamily)